MKKTEIPDTTIKIESSLKAETVISIAIDKLGPKRVLNMILSQCLTDTISTAQFPSMFLASVRDEEKADVTAALWYLKKNWKEMADKGMKLLMKKGISYENT